MHTENAIAIGKDVSSFIQRKSPHVADEANVNEKIYEMLSFWNNAFSLSK